MATFADLPNELVLKILWQTDPRDLESLSLITKHVYYLATQLLHEHRGLKRRWSCLTPREGDAPDDVGNWYAEYLITMLRNPRIALYVTDFHPKYALSHWTELDEDPDPEELSTCHLPYHPAMFDQIEHAVRGTDMIPSDQVDEWIAKIRHGDEDPIIALLLLHLPSLQTIRYNLSHERMQSKVKTAIQNIVRTGKQPYLSQLKEVTLDFEWQWYRDRTERCNLIQAFMTLPSVQILHVESLIVQEGTIRKLDLSDLGKGSNVAELSFTRGFIGTTTLCPLIEQTRCLKSFTWDTGQEYGDETLHSSLLNDALVASAGSTLENLTLRAHGHQTTSLGSLHDFECLRELEFDVAILFNPDGSDIKTWPKRLPPSLEKLSLALEDEHIMQTPENFCEAFRCLLRARNEQTPRLKDILILMHSAEHCREAYDHVQYPCSSSGILLHHKHPSGSGHMDPCCGECEDCKSVLERFLRESGGPQSYGIHE